MIFSAFT